MYESILLPYSYDSLEPFLSARTISIHYNKHYKNYLNNLNNLLNSVNYNYKYSKVDLIKHISDFPIEIRDDILFNLGGVINHELYFLGLGRKNNLPYDGILTAINKYYGSYDNFKIEFINTAKKLVGSGYTSLTIDKNNNLDIINTSNQETPYLYGLYPLITLDLWEHAYYLDYQNNKNAYIEAFFQNIDFSYINTLYAEALKKIKESNK